MKKSEIVIGGVYLAKVSGKITKVRVDGIREVQKYGNNRDYSGRLKIRDVTVYDVTNLSTKRELTFCSAAKFRGVASEFLKFPRNEAIQKKMDEILARQNDTLS